MTANIISISPSEPPADPWQWMLETCLPVWADPGIHPEFGGFVECLNHKLQPALTSETRLRVQARQIYAFSHAYGLTGDTRWRDIASNGLEFLIEHGWDRDVGGWIHRLEPNGRTVDRRRDTYDHAFVLFALAHYARWIDIQAVTPWINETLTFLTTEMADPRHGGFMEERREASGILADPSPLPRRQNPHMHLFEALLALFDATGDGHYLAQADQIFDLFERHFRDPLNGSLAEYFDDQWTPLAGHQGSLREPGHHFEWVWLLHQYAKHRPSKRDTAHRHARDLFVFATQYGLTHLPDGSLIARDEVDSKGIALSNTARLWPQTEAIKADLAMAVTGESDGNVAQQIMETLFRYYLDYQGGHWCDQITDEGIGISENVPTSSLYHLMMAITEWHGHEPRR
ncbi:MAG: AGE family epimerase/isomerase [Pseudomonadota bacterium]